MKTNNFIEGKLVILFIILIIGMTGVVSAISWNSGASSVNYTTSEGDTYNYNFSDNITGYSDDVTFAIDTTQFQIYLTNNSGKFNVSQNYISPWILMTNLSSGNFTINATYNNQTGFFEIPIQAKNITDSTANTEVFEFIIDAVNDAPNFFLNSSYDTPVSIIENTTKNISLVGTDEEKQYPLKYNVTFGNCSFASWSSRNNSDCSLDYEMFGDSNTTSTLAFSNLSYNDVGVYNLTICAHDDVSTTPLPLYRDSNYDKNKSTCKNTTLTLSSSLSIDVSNCSDVLGITEGEQFNCTINITTIGISDDLNMSTYAFFKDGTTNPPDNHSWFYANSSNTSNDFTYSIPISILPTKREVGNWTINFTATDGKIIKTEPINLFVNWIESNVSLDAILDMTIYSDANFTVKGYDDDLLILDKIVRNEILTYASNTSWVSVTSPSQTNLKNNWTTSTIAINYTNVSLGNHSVVISVVDKAGNSVDRTFTIQVLNDTAPEWNSSLPNPVFLNLTENKPFFYNMSVNVNDADNDSINFYYQNNSEEFCSLNASNFNSTSGIINFTATDCDVGLHNITIIASDGMLNSTSHQFIFNISNIDDTPSVFSLTGDNSSQTDLLTNPTFIVTNGKNSTFSLVVEDDDFLIPLAQRADYYNESLIVVVNSTNSTNQTIDLFNFSFVNFGTGGPANVEYTSSFTPDVSQIGNYTVFINITDKDGNSTNRTFHLEIVKTNYPPSLTTIDNKSLSINDYLNFTVNATDDEDNYNNISLIYSITNLSSGSPNLIVGNTTGKIEFNMSSNESYAGKWEYSVKVKDSGNLTDSKIFYVYVYGTPNITLPSSNYIFNWSEGNTTGNLNFSVNYSVNDTNLTYLFYLDKIIYSNSTTFEYFNQTIISADNLKNKTNWTWTNETNFSWNFIPSYNDESYGKLKNLTLLVYNPDYPSLNSSVNWKVNISHTNQNITFTLNISNQSGYTNSNLLLNLTKYFEDADHWDKKINQIVNFTISTQTNYTNNIQYGSSFSNWILNLNSNTPTTEVIKITAHEYNSTNVLIGNATSNWFEVTLKKPPIKKKVTTITVTTTQLKYYTMRIIVPHDIIISNQNFIKIPFSLQNTGAVDLSGINLSSQVLYNNAFSNNVKISLGTTFISLLKIGETKNYTMTILADTSKSGRYKATLLANVTSPKFSDWGDFFIDLKKTNETEVEQRLIFTEKLVAENPECLELTELIKRARSAFSAGNLPLALQTSKKVSNACKKAITANEQIKYKPSGFIQRNFYNISFLTLMIFVIGFILYIYKRVRFNKSNIDNYNR